MKRVLSLIFLVACFNACSDDSKKDVDSDLPVQTVVAAPTMLSYSVINQYPHDTASFTEGLEFYNGKLYESGGDYENSVLQYGDVKTGKIEKKHKMGTAEIFAEGITILNGKIYQLTYTTNTVYVYDIKDITKPIKTFSWPGEGWGMTNNGKEIIMDAGNNNLYFIDPETFKVIRTLPVVDNKGIVDQINELEYIDGFVWANIWETNRIVKIDPQSGYVVAEMNMNNLLQDSDKAGTRADVLNGIAYDSTSKTMFVTGKRWPKIFEIRIN